MLGIALKGLGIAGATAAAVYGAVALYGADAITRRPRRQPHLGPHEIWPAWEDVAFRDREDRLKLSGWWFSANEAARALILVHGRGQCRSDKEYGADAVARRFLEQGYSVLLFDLRAHGESEGRRLSYCVQEKDDVLGALDFVRARGFAEGNIAFVGVSYGGAAVLAAAPEMPDVGAVVSDSAYAAIWPVILREIPRQQPLLALLRPAPGIARAARWLFGVHLPAARPVDAVARVPNRPILFIHGAADDYVVPDHARQLHAASAHRASELWLVPDASHARTFLDNPDRWLARVTQFFDVHMPRRTVQGITSV